MIRVLHVLGGLGTGGTESLIMNWYRNIDRSKIQFDFLVRSSDDNYAKEIEFLGGKIYYTASFPKHFIKNYYETKAILTQKKWDVVHVHGNAAMYMLPLKLAKKLGYTNRIMHSHSVKAQNTLFKLVHLHNRRKIHKFATTCLACSTPAGHWMYGNNNFQVLKNTIEIQKYLFCNTIREEYRRDLHVEDAFVVGHVGRFAMPKNHSYLLEIFREIKKRKPNSKLLLVGDGELQENITQKAKVLNIDSDIIFTGRRADIGALLSAMDVFVLPSLFEGMPVVCVECCANELPVIISEEAYAKEIDDLPNVRKFSLKHTPSEWAEFILSTDCNITNRGAIKVLEHCGYDLSSVIEVLNTLYIT